jgi:drug/metabolite transporter (DMT)-like permease
MNFNTARFWTNPYLLLTLTALFWSGNMVLGRGIRADVPPMALAFWRWAIAFCSCYRSPCRTSKNSGRC